MASGLSGKLTVEGSKAANPRAPARGPGGVLVPAVSCPHEPFLFFKHLMRNPDIQVKRAYKCYN
jgi:hypothetical protein